MIGGGIIRAKYHVTGQARYLWDSFAMNSTCSPFTIDVDLVIEMEIHISTSVISPPVQSSQYVARQTAEVDFQQGSNNEAECHEAELYQILSISRHVTSR